MLRYFTKHGLGFCHTQIVGVDISAFPNFLHKSDAPAPTISFDRRLAGICVTEQSLIKFDNC